MSRLPHLSAWQRHRLKAAFLGFGRFTATVVCSALLAAWILDPASPWRGWARNGFKQSASMWRKPSQRTMAASTSPAAVPPAVTLAGTPAKTKTTWGDRYARYFDEAIPLLRSDKKVRLVSMELPAGILSYQQNAAAMASGYRLSTVSPRIPVLAVSRNAREFLSTMRITFVDPKVMPEETMAGAKMPMTWDTLEDDFVLVPDLSGANARHFLFTRR